MDGKETENLTQKDYDFIIVGAGSAGCLIASRLSRQLPTHRILVLEAGEHICNDPKVQIPGLSVSLQSDPTYDWQYVSEPEAGLNGRRIKHPRGKLVGGTSAINSHSVVFPNTEWQDRIAEDLLPGYGKRDWSSEGMRNCYAQWQSERTGISVDEDAVQTSFPRNIDFLQLQWMKVFEKLGYEPSETGFVKSKAGAVTVTNAVNAVRGERSHASTAFLEPALERGNVTLKTGVEVKKIVFDETLTPDGKLNARGIRYKHEGKSHIVTAKEVVMCAGVFESPAVLERSGIGSREILEAAEIPVLYELPGVGENLQDHLNCAMSLEVQDNIPTHDHVLQDPEVREAEMEEYERSRTGRLAEGSAYSFAFTPLQMLETSAETKDLIAMVENHLKQKDNQALQTQYSLIQKAIEAPTEATAITLLLRIQRHRDLDSLPKDTPSFVPGNYVTVVAMLAHPFSRGSCHVTSANASEHPTIKFNYLSHPLDTEILARHMVLIEHLFQQPTFTAIAKPDGRRLPRSFPYPITNLEEAKKMLPVNAATNYHPCGTCSMMREDLGGVVDGNLRVYGMRNVRVCDASVLPVIPRGNILAAVYAWAEKGAELILKGLEVGE
jgi:choline dehydrogenase-like flavoprotein